jgi:hypothetical protein
MERTTKGLLLEIVKIRFHKESEGTVKEVIRDLLADPAVRTAKEVRVFSNEVGDMAVHISWDSGMAPHDGSALGLQLAAALSEHGLTNHTIWIEEV